jgi:hypothetical protein
MKNVKIQQHLQKASLSTQLSTAQVEDGSKQLNILHKMKMSKWNNQELKKFENVCIA